MAPVTLPVMVLTTALGAAAIVKLLQHLAHRRRQRFAVAKQAILAQALIGVWLIVALAFHLAEVGLIGLSVIILATTFTAIRPTSAR
jgi:NhaB family Na+:H+ antiporter